MIHYGLGFGELNALTEEQFEFLFAGLVWYGKIKIRDVDKIEKMKWDKLRLMVGSG